MVRGIRKMLCFETEAEVFMIVRFAFANDRTVEEISGIELYPRLRCPDFKHAAAQRLNNACRKRNIRGSSVQNVIVVIAAGNLLDA